MKLLTSEQKSSFLRSRSVNDNYRDIYHFSEKPFADRLRLEQNGIVKWQLMNFKDVVNLEWIVIAEILGVSARHLHYLTLQCPLSKKLTSRLMAIIELYSNIYSTFKNKAHSDIWVKAPALELNWQAPVNLMPYALGLEEIKRVLNKTSLVINAEWQRNKNRSL